MRRWLDLEGVTLAPLYALRRDEQPTLYLFEYVRELTGPTGSVAQRVWNCLLRADEPFAPLAMRAHPKRYKVIESLEASRTGSSIVDLPSSCDRGITVFARDADRAAQILTRPVCDVLSRALGSRAAASVVMGERHVLATLEPPGDGGPDGDDAADLERLEALAADVFALYALLRSGS